MRAVPCRRACALAQDHESAAAPLTDSMRLHHWRLSFLTAQYAYCTGSAEQVHLAHVRTFSSCMC